MHMSRIYILLILAVFVAGIAGCGNKSAKAQGPLKLYTTPADSGGGGMSCFALNVSEETLSEVRVKLVQADGSSFFQQVCSNLDPDESCILSIQSNVPRYCLIEVTGDDKNAVRGSLTVQNSSGVTVLSLEAR